MDTVSAQVDTVSPLPEIAGAPTDSQRALILKALEDMLSDRHQLDQEIKGVKAVLEQLLRERRVLSQHIVFNSALLASVRRMPPEIISEIFCSCLDDPRDADLRPRPNRVPLVLTRICRSWRAIALSTPELWSRLDICVEGFSPLKMDLVKEWFARTGVHPLYLKIRIRAPWLSNKWVEILQTSHSRWRHVSLYLGPLALKRLCIQILLPAAQYSRNTLSTRRKCTTTHLRRSSLASHSHD
jgi:hypothetical protein